MTAWAQGSALFSIMEKCPDDKVCDGEMQGDQQVLSVVGGADSFCYEVVPAHHSHGLHSVVSGKVTPALVVDAGATSTVTGISWMRLWRSHLLPKR